LSREEVEAMLGLTLQQTRVYQEAKAEGREEQKAEMLLEQTRIYQEALIIAPNRSQTDPFPGGAIAQVEGDWICLK